MQHHGLVKKSFKFNIKITTHQLNCFLENLIAFEALTYIQTLLFQTERTLASLYHIREREKKESLSERQR